MIAGALNGCEDRAPKIRFGRLVKAASATAMSAIIIVLLFILCGMSGSETVVSKCRVTSSECLPRSLAVWQKPRPAASLLDCFVSSRSFGLHSVGVVQRNRRDASCALFRFGQVCQLLSLINISSSSTGGKEVDCDIVVDSVYDAITANEHFSAVWVGDRGPALENLVCGSEGQRNPMRSSNVTWTSEGARMDGVSSRLWVDDPTGLDFIGSFTWVLHLKRSPGKQCFIELMNCADHDERKDHFYEASYITGRDLSLFLNSGVLRQQTESVLPTDPDQFFVVGVVLDRVGSRVRFFVNDSFITDELVVSLPPSINFMAPKDCLKVGWRNPSQYLLKGAVRAVAVAKSVLSANEIRRLFALISE